MERNLYNALDKRYECQRWTDQQGPLFSLDIYYSLKGYSQRCPPKSSSSRFMYQFCSVAQLCPTWRPHGLQQS